MRVERLSLARARRLALAAQGFGDRPPGTVDRRQLTRLVRRLGLLQIDSVNVLQRAHYMPPFARLGRYATADLDALAWERRGRKLFEYWGHEASLLPIEAWPLFGWRRDDARRFENLYAGLAKIGREQPELVERVLDMVRQRGPIAAGEIDIPEAVGRGGSWWGWSDAKRALEFLFWSGQVTTATRRNFERHYDLPERVLPREIVASPPIARDEAQRRLLMIAAEALGVATESDLRDYFRLPTADTKTRIAELVDAGMLVPAGIEGWSQPAYLHPDAAAPRRIEAKTLLSPFDPLIWERPRTARLWGFHYRIEIYVPEAKRVHGYYVLPFLLGDMLAARVDLKADRATRTLRVCAAWAEVPGSVDSVAPALIEALGEMAGWLGLDRVAVSPKGDLADALARHHAAAWAVEAANAATTV